MWALDLSLAEHSYISYENLKFPCSNISPFYFLVGATSEIFMFGATVRPRKLNQMQLGLMGRVRRRNYGAGSSDQEARRRKSGPGSARALAQAAFLARRFMEVTRRSAPGGGAWT